MARGGAGRVAALSRSGGGQSSRALGPLAALAGLASIATTLADSSLSRRQKVTETSGAVGGAAGAIGGAKLGAVAGAVGGPLAPLTVPAGALIGGGLGYFFGDKIATRLAELLQAETAGKAAGRDAPEAKVAIEMRVDAEGRPRLTKVRSNSRNVSLDVDMGLVMVN